MKLWYSYLKELKLSSKSFYFYIELVMAVIIIFVLLVFIPENITSRVDEYIVIDAPDQVREYLMTEVLDEDLDGKLETAVLELDKEEVEVDLVISEDKNLYIFEDLDTMVALTEVDRPSVGALIRYDEEKQTIVYEYYLQGYESERLVNLYRIFHTESMEVLMESYDQVESRALETGFTQLNSREMALPSLLTFNGSLMGMFIIAAYIFLDKQEGIIKAYAVTASKVWHYLMSKVLVMMTVTVVTTFAITIAVRGLDANYPMMLLLLLTSAFFGSSFGLWISSFYDNMTKAFAAIYAAMMVFMLPAIGYFIPSWEPTWLKLIPSHYLINGFKEIIISKGDMGYVAVSSLGFLIVGILFFMISDYRFKKTLAG